MIYCAKHKIVMFSSHFSTRFLKLTNELNLENYSQNY